MTPSQTTAKSAPIDEPLTDRASLVGVVRRPRYARRPRLGFDHLAVLAWCALGLVVVGVSPAVAQPPRSGSDRAGSAVSIRWRSCGVRLDCARVRVPLDWARPAGPKITLAVIRHRASRPGKRIGTLFFNPGGPGVSGVGDVKDPFVSRLLDEAGGGRFDVVSWDPRGVGASTHVRCFRNELNATRFWGGLTVPTTVAASRRYLAKAIEYARRCAQLSGSLLAHISTADTVRDLDYLRVLLHQRRLTYLGWSYGTFLGQTYANMFPGRVRAMCSMGWSMPSATCGARSRFRECRVVDRCCVRAVRGALPAGWSCPLRARRARVS